MASEVAVEKKFYFFYFDDVVFDFFALGILVSDLVSSLSCHFGLEVLAQFVNDCLAF